MPDKFPIPTPTTPIYLDSFFGKVEGSDGDNVINTLAHATNQAKAAWKASFGYYKSRQDDQTLSEPVRLVKTGQFVRAQIDKANEHHNAALKAAGPVLAELTADLNRRLAPPSSAGAASIHAEIRRALAGIESAEARTQAIEAAFDAGDLETVAAVVEAPAMLSGLVAPAHQRIKSAFLKRIAPETFERHQAVSEAVTISTTALTQLSDHANRIVNWSEVASLEAGAKEPAAA